NSNFGASAGFCSLAAAFATQATGSVRLQVTGRPPTSRKFSRGSAQPNAPKGIAAASALLSTWRRVKKPGGFGICWYIGAFFDGAGRNSTGRERRNAGQ